MVSIENDKVFISADPEILKNKKIKGGLAVYATVNSTFDENTGKRKIKLNFSELEKQIPNSGNRKTLKQSQDEMIKLGLWKQDGKEIEIIRPESKFVVLTREFAQQLATELPDHAIKIYLYLLNNYNIWNIGKKKAFRFSRSQLATEALGLTAHAKNLEMVSRLLNHLADNMLIQCQTVRVNKTYYLKLTQVGKRFIKIDEIEKCKQQSVQGLSESNFVDTEIANDMEESVVNILGYDIENIEQGLIALPAVNDIPLLVEETVKPPQCYDGHSWFDKDYDGSSYMRNIILEYPQENAEYIKYWNIV